MSVVQDGITKETADLQCERADMHETLKEVAVALEAVERLAERGNVHDSMYCMIGRDHVECLFRVFSQYIQSKFGIGEEIQRERLDGRD